MNRKKIGKDQIERGWFGVKVKEPVSVNGLDAAFDTGHAEVFPDAAGAMVIAVHKDGLRRTPAEGLNAHASGAGKEIQNSRVWHKVAETGKNRRPHAVHRGPQTLWRRFERTTARAAGNDPHSQVRGWESPRRRVCFFSLAGR